MAKNYLTVRLTSQTEIIYYYIVGHSDPILLNGKCIAQRIKGTLGITGL